MATDRSDWLTKVEAAEFLGVTTKTVERWEARNELERSDRAVAGANKVAIYSPASLKRFKETRLSVAVTPTVQPSYGSALVRSKAPQKHSTPNSAMADFLSLLSSSQQITIKDKLFLTIRESAQLSGLPASYLKGMVVEGTLEGKKIGRSWKIRQSDLRNVRL